MSQNYCPACGEPISAEQMNLAEGVALCPSCGQLSRLADVVGAAGPAAELLDQTPPGCRVSMWGQEIRVLTPLRSIGALIGTLFFALFWNGIVSVFVLIALAGLYTNLVGPLPAWFPAPNMDHPMPLGMTLFLCVFLLPFITIGASLLAAALLYAAGKIEVRIGDHEALVRTGIAFLAWSRRFDPTEVRRVDVGTTSWETNGRPGRTVVIEADRHVKFGSLLTDERREWMRAILHVLLVQPGSRQRDEILSRARQAF